MKGAPELPRANASPEDIRSITRQNEAAQTLSEHGFNVEQLPNNQGKNGLKNPDFRVNGELADAYSPSGNNVQTIFEEIAKKTNPAKPQAPNIVLNLVDSPLTASEVAQYLSRNPVPGLRSIVFIKDGLVTVVRVGG